MKKIIMIAVFVLLIATTGFASSIVVDCNGNGDYTTIEAGIYNAQDGDVVWVLNGVYYENNLSWQNKHITVRSYGGPDNCFIDGDEDLSYYSVFNLTDSNINNNDLIYGFTIRDFEFDGDSSPEKGAVISCTYGASPIIRNCIIEGCEYDNSSGTAHYGLGIAIYCEGNTIVEDCVIRNNEGIDVEGGVAIACKGNVTIQNNDIYNNKLSSYTGFTADREGIVIYIVADEDNSPTIDNNEIYNNTYETFSVSEASLIYSEFDDSWDDNEDPIEITNNTIYSNDSQQLIHLTDNAEIEITGNLIYENNCDYSSSVICIEHVSSYSSSDSYIINNNTIVDNDCYDSMYDLNKAAIYLGDSGYYNGIYNNIIAFNEGYGIRWNTGTERLIVGYSDLYDNSLGNYDSAPTQELNCIHINPNFTNRASDDYTLKWNAGGFSPCIDTGHPSAQYEDADGTPADMGAIPVASHDYFKDDYDNEEFDNVDWMAFPVLNRTTTNWMRADSVLIKQGLMDDDWQYLDDILYRVVYQNANAVWYDGDWQINLTNDEFDSKQGYKIELKEQYDNIPVRGISGTWQDESTKIGLLTEQENWIGCFLEEPASFIDAFDSIWDEWSAVYSEHWAVERPEPGTTPAIVNLLTVNPGELYIIEVYEECDLIWNESSPPVPPKTKEMTDYFTYNEKIDYMAINIDTVYSDSSIAEIAVFSDDQCIGASKVYDDEYPVQILAYTPETLKNGNNGLEFKLYYEGQKGEPSKSIPFIMYSKEIQAYIAKPLYYERKSFATVKLNTDEASINQQLTLLQNYPNPVRTNMTTIRFMPQQNAHHTELNIYNIRGQLVQTIDCDGIISSGTKDLYYSTSWDCRDMYGKDITNGIYFYKLTSGDKTAVHKMLLMK